jgi:hypothetical protein
MEMEEVIGSIPIRSINPFQQLRGYCASDLDRLCHNLPIGASGEGAAK